MTGANQIGITGVVAQHVAGNTVTDPLIRFLPDIFHPERNCGGVRSLFLMWLEIVLAGTMTAFAADSERRITAHDGRVTFHA